MNENKRQQKISRLLQKDLSEIIRERFRDELKNAIISVTRAEVSPDLSVAKIYLSALAVGPDQNPLELVEAHQSEIRKLLGFRIGKQVRRIPELIFIEDQGSQHAAEMDQLLNRLDIPPQEDH